jgi:hypothetical protein
VSRLPGRARFGKQGNTADCRLVRIERREGGREGGAGGGGNRATRRTQDREGNPGLEERSLARSCRSSGADNYWAVEQYARAQRRPIVR